MRRWPAPAALFIAAIALAGPAGAQGILLASDSLPRAEDIDGCMKTAEKAFSGTGLVVEISGAAVFGSNEDRTLTVRCDIPSTILIYEAFFPGDKDRIDPIKAALATHAAAPLIASQSKSHQYTVACARGQSCAIDAPAVCRQAYPTSPKAAAKELTKGVCADAQGSYTCSVAYDLNCN